MARLWKNHENFSAYSKFSFFALSAVLFLFNFHFSYNNMWIEDFWVFVGLLREVSQRPLNPTNPFVLGEKANIPYMPYLLIVCFLSSVFHMKFEIALICMGFFNLALFLFFFRKFLIKLLGSETTVFFSTIFILFLWGSSPWLVSGFLHFYTLFYVIPYPSTFAVALSFACFWLYLLFLEQTNWRVFAALLAVCCVVILTHPLSFLFTSGGMCALTVKYVDLRRTTTYLPILFSLLFCFLIAAIWPYFPLFSSVSSNQYAADPSASVMYYKVFHRVWPALIGLPCLLYRLRNDTRDPLVWMFIGFSSCYTFGGATLNWSYGRILSSLVIVLQIAAAHEFGRYIEKRGIHLFKKSCGLSIFGGVFVAVVCLSLSVYILHYRTPEEGPQKYSFLSQFVHPNDVVLADTQVSLIIPALGAKVVFFPRPSFLGSSYAERSKDVMSFFSSYASVDIQRNILAKYQVKYILFRKNGASTTNIKTELFANEDIVYQDKNSLLVQIPPFPS